MTDKMVELPADVIRLVVAARLAIEADELSDDKELLDALEAFSSRVCYDDEGGSLPEAHADPCICGRSLAQPIGEDEAGFVRNCTITPRKDEGPLFKQGVDGRITPFLDGYAIIPDEHLVAPNIDEPAWLRQLRAWAYPQPTDNITVEALKKAGRLIKQMDAEKAWCSSDVQDALSSIRAALKGGGHVG